MTVSLSVYFDLLRQYLQQQRNRVLLLAILLATQICLQLIPPQIMRTFIDIATDTSTTSITAEISNQLLWLAGAIVGIVLVQQVITVFVTHVGETVAWTATNAMRLDLMDHCLHLDMAFHNEHTPGEMIERIDGDVTTLASFFSKFVITILGNGLLLLGIVSLLFTIDWRVGLVGLGITLVAMATLARIRNLAVPYAAAYRESLADFSAYVEERLGGIDTIRTSGAIPYVMQRFYAQLRVVLHASLRDNLAAGVGFSSMIFLFATGIALILGLSGWLYWQELVTIGGVYLIYHYASMLVIPINVITRQMEDLQRAGGSITRLQALLQVEQKEGNSKEGNSKEGDIKGREPSGCLQVNREAGLAVRFDAVTFGYNAEQSVLENISFQLEPGTKLGLVGRTGSGKTTIARLLLRLYEPNAGTISLGTDPLQQLSLTDLRQQVGLVTQNVQLFHATLRDNLTFWNHDIDDRQIEEALRMVDLWSWVSGLPDGLDTLLAGGNSGLSAGEAQLLALARIFLRNPGLVILDEASSRLDPATEKRLDQAIATLLQDRTAIVIAHRLETIQRVDEVMILENGRIMEHGSRVPLAADTSSQFYQLLQTSQGILSIES